MKNSLKKLYKPVLTLAIAALLFCAALICASAVPALPGTGRTGDEAICRSHPGELVTLNEIPVRRSGAHYAPSRGGAQKTLPLVTVVVGFDGVPYENGFDWNEAIFSGEKSLAAYYTDMSFGRFTFAPAPETGAFGVGDNANTADRAGDGVIHVNVPLPHKNWTDENEYPALVNALIAALAEADAYIDFASFDADGDGVISNAELAVSFVLAGYEGSASYTYKWGKDNYFWAHAWRIGDIINEHSLPLEVPVLDGVAVSDYVAIAEKLDDQSRNPISVFAHELGHYLGLPDLYDTLENKRNEWGKYAVSDFSVMASGSWGTDPDGGYIPYSMDVWSRYTLGWFTPDTAEADGEYPVAAQSYTQNDAFRALIVPTPREGEYYLLENRQFTKWDAGMADDYGEGGVILWHIDDAVIGQYNEDNRVNDSDHRPGVMPLYPEIVGEEYAYIGKTDAVYTDAPFYNKTVWAQIGGEGTRLDLPLYGEGENADKRAGRTLSGVEIGFLTDSAPEMTVRLGSDNHKHILSAVARTEPGCETVGIEAHWVCDYCGTVFADGNGTYAVELSALEIPAAGHSWGKWKTTVKPGCETEGARVRVCSKCKNEETETLDALGHTEPDRDGLCERCGEQIAQPEAPEQPENLCKYCGKDHSDQVFGKIVQLFHNIFYFFKTLFAGN